MKVRNLFAVLAAVGIVGLAADTAVAQVDVKPGGATVTGPAGNNLNVPFTGQAPTVTQPGTVAQPGTAGTFTPGTLPGAQPGTFTPGTQPGTYAPGTSGYYPGYSTYPGGYYQPTPGTSSYYQQPYMPGYSYYTPGQGVTTAGGYMPQQAVAGGGCCGAVTPVGYSTAAAGGCCGATAAPVASGGCGCDPCSTGRHRRGLFRRY
jgi:hypothetical protein